MEARDVPATGLGVANDYSVFVINDVNLQYSDVQGRMAVGGNATITGYAVGDRLGNSYGTRDDLIVGGNLDISNGQVYFGNTVYGGTGTIASNFGHPNGTVRQQAGVIDFDAAESSLEALADSYAALPKTGNYVNQYGTIMLNGKAGQNVFNVPASVLWTANDLRIKAPAGATVIVNVTGGGDARMQFMGYHLEGGVDKDGVILNFPQATKVTLQGIGIFGNVLAPRAFVDFSNGQLNGTLVADSWCGYGQVNLPQQPPCEPPPPPPPPPPPDCPPPPPVCEPPPPPVCEPPPPPPCEPPPPPPPPVCEPPPPPPCEPPPPPCEPEPPVCEPEPEPEPCPPPPPVCEPPPECPPPPPVCEPPPEPCPPPPPVCEPPPPEPVCAPLPPSKISGLVYADKNKDGVAQDHERRLKGIRVTLKGWDADGNRVVKRTTTDAGGIYEFDGLRAGSYKITMNAPPGYRAGGSTTGAFGGQAGANVIADITIPQGQSSGGYNLGQIQVDCGFTPHTPTNWCGNGGWGGWHGWNCRR